MATAAARKYARDGQISLSVGFIQRFFEAVDTNSRTAERPILQIVGFKPITSNEENGVAARLRITDGIFAYSAGFLGLGLRDQMEREKIGTEGRCDVIIVKRFGDWDKFSVKGKKPIIIEEYELLDSSQRPLNEDKLIRHEGATNDHRGYKPSTEVSFYIDTKPVIEDENYGEEPPAKRSAMGSGARPTTSAPMTPSRSGSGLQVTPIHMITPYVNKWRIMGVVTSREELKTIKSRQGNDIKVFNFTLTDRNGDSIRIAAFGETADKFFPMLQKDQTFYVMGGTVRAANTRFNTTGHAYEITLRNDSEVTPCEDKIKAPPLHLNVVPLNRLPEFDTQMVDVLAVIHKLDEPVDFVSKAGNPLTKRLVHLVDSTETEATLTLWGDAAKSCAYREGTVLGIKGARVSTFQNAVQLGTSSATLMQENPEGIVEVTALRDWYHDNSESTTFTNVSAPQGGGPLTNFEKDLRLIGAITELQLGRDEACYVNVVATLTTIKSDNPFYSACPEPACPKKVVPSDGAYRCERCNRSFENFKHAYALQMELADGSGMLWATAFGDAASKVMGMSANELAQLKEEKGEEAYNAVFDRARLQTWNFRLRAKSELYNDEQRMRYAMMTVDAVPIVKYEAAMNKLINQLQDL